jgi:hypothetical protein
MLASATEVVRGCGHGSSEGRSSSKKLELMRRVASRCSTVLTALAPVSPRKLSASPASSTTPPLSPTHLALHGRQLHLHRRHGRACRRRLLLRRLHPHRHLPVPGGRQRLELRRQGGPRCLRRRLLRRRRLHVGESGAPLSRTGDCATLLWGIAGTCRRVQSGTAKGMRRRLSLRKEGLYERRGWGERTAFCAIASCSATSSAASRASPPLVDAAAFCLAAVSSLTCTLGFAFSAKL